MGNRVTVMRRRVNLERHYTKWGYIFIIPFVVAFLLFNFWPLFNTFYYSFCYLKHAGNTNPQLLPFADKPKPLLTNFQEVLKAKSFHSALKNSFLFFIASTIPEWILAFWLSVMMTDRRMHIKGRFVFKTAFFLPKLMAGSVVGINIISTVINFAGNFGYFTSFAFSMNGFGITPDDLKFMTSVQFFIIVASIFLHFGITFIYAVAGITGIPVETFEAAEIDGANRLQTFFRITLPSMRPMLFFITVVSVVDGLGMYDIPSLFGAYDTTRSNLTLMMYMQNQAFQGSYAYDRASAASLIMLAIYIIAAVIVYFVLLRDKDEIKLKRQRRQELRELKRGI